ncbi:MAG: TetR/AcrR family transcriptional regulator [Gammaproteobacteria bacterium]|nr:TetR/AcrR family transcriptional regulator [Gammaproteobacteria bacterium]MDH3373081.1 TetR/AcrR family transcriptional regulator [Gammaproteobacteria bacterium]MDH3408313.1 TetR/AcrR family transcriptional regulator [Gammaproteobacteria bacterium]MDH3553028.1 TetR/AcrR family transcriptional regulator [Gammaproteobacteria bacterium]
MSEPRFQRRKEERPQEITEAAFAAFAEKGYAATRVDDVARRAGVSKGLLYLYFRTKEELFKAVIRSLVMPRIDALTARIDSADMSAEEFLRGPFMDFVKTLPGSPVAVVIRLLIAEGPKHPDLVQFYWDNVVSRGLATITRLLERGVVNGEFRRTQVNEMPHLLIMPVVFSVVFKLLFEEQSLDTDKLIETQVDMLLAHMKGELS